jgi:isopenicillin-N N-acyltransferase like protein
MPVSPPRFVDVSGRPFEQGRQQGAAARDQIHDNVETVHRGIAQLARGGHSQDYDRLTAANEAFVGRESPQTLEEIAGIANGACLDYRDLLLLNLPVYQVGKFMSTECTQILLRPPVTADGHTYLAKARDLRGEPFHQLVLRRTLPGGAWIVEANVAGCVTWPGIGVNNHGLAMATSGVWSKRTTVDWSDAGSAWLMINAGVLLRESHSVAEFAENLERHPRLTPDNCVAADPTTASIFEIMPDRVYSAPVLDGWGVRSNHTHAPELAALAPTPAEYPSTFHRYTRAQAEIRRRSWTLTALAELMADHDGYPQSSICRHQHAENDARTMYASIVRVDDGLSVTLMGNPCERLPLPFTDDGPITGSPGVIVVHPPA